MLKSINEQTIEENDTDIESLNFIPVIKKLTIEIEESKMKKKLK